jgi:hypothetical protein
MIALISASLFAACAEVDQDAPKPFAGEDEIRSYAGAPFNGDKELYEKKLQERAQTQDEYLQMPENDARPEAR